MEIRLAQKTDAPQVIVFFGKYLSPDNEAIYSSEFLCPDGVKAAIFRNEMIVAVINEQIIGAARFYRRKKDKVIALYQFAVDLAYRRQGVMAKMLEIINDTRIIACCPARIDFNLYYQRTGWKLIRSDIEFNFWMYREI